MCFQLATTINPTTLCFVCAYLFYLPSFLVFHQTRPEQLQRQRETRGGGPMPAFKYSIYPIKPRAHM
jgi:hypothetical protein